MNTEAPIPHHVLATHPQSALARSVAFSILALLHAGCFYATGELEADPSAVVEDRGASLTGAVGETWMEGLDDELGLSELTIPGTHDSMAFYEPFIGTAKCQKLRLADQLNAGVRFLDIRCRHFGDSFTIHHGSVYQHANFDDVLDTVIGFLDAHPSEAVIMSVKQEHTASGNTRSFVQTFESYVARNPSKWNLASNIPTLGEARGKITLFRRFGGSAQGLDAASWPDKTTFTSGNIRVQDVYSVGNTNTKWTQVESLLREALSGSQSTLYVNFTSGVGSILGIPNIPTVANPINQRLASFFGNASGRYGVVVMDFADVALTAKIYNANSE